MILFLGRLLLLMIVGLPAARGQGFCGRLDLPAMKSAEILDVLWAYDAEKGRSNEKRIQCGLPGETLPLCSSCEAGDVSDAMKALRPIIGSEDHLAWHSKWHLIRSQDDLSEATFADLKRMGYVPPSMSKSSFKDHLFKGAKFGEDFFYMHRLMIKMVQLELASKGKPCIAGWANVPSRADDPQWPVPMARAGIVSLEKADRTLAALQEQLVNLRKPELLRKLTLNQLGLRVEPTLHQRLHSFFECAPETIAQGTCDALIPVETSPLNPYFWKIHGLVDDLIGDWLLANEYDAISTDCGKRARCYTWQNPWLGKTPKGERR